MVVLARIVLPPLALHSLTLSGVLLATLGAIFLAYDLLGRENGPLRWFTLVITCGLLSALILVPVVTLVDLLLDPQAFFHLAIHTGRRIKGILHGHPRRITLIGHEAAPHFLARGAAWAGTGIPVLVGGCARGPPIRSSCTYPGPCMRHVHEHLATTQLATGSIRSHGAWDGAGCGRERAYCLRSHAIKHRAIGGVEASSSEAPRLFTQRVLDRAGSRICTVVLFWTCTELCWISKVYRTWTRLLGDDKPIRGRDLCLSECGCREHRPVHVMEGQSITPSYPGSHWSGPPGGSFRFTRRAINDRHTQRY
jgi:hypothetical protein